MRLLWQRGLRRWPYLLAGLAFVLSTGFAFYYGVQHASAPGFAESLAAGRVPNQSAWISPGHLRTALAEVLVSIESVGAVFWPLMTLLALLLMLRLGAAIAGVGYDCGRLLVWAIAVLITVLQVPGMA